MKPYELRDELFVPRPLEEVFALFDRPENLAKITPRWLSFAILTPTPIPMHEGAILDYAIQIGPFPSRWRSIITAYEPPFRFVDEQLLGPYSYWHHTHSFEKVEGGTRIVDQVRYLPPFGILGRFAHFLFIRRQLEAIFLHRRVRVLELLGGGVAPADAGGD
ncbi:MAG: SRPBCC family protein [Planctomycetota bacterium]|jgi:ligand-binding SRPBCC domain-containing protein